MFNVLVYLHCFEQLLRVGNSHPCFDLQFVSCILALSSRRVFRPIADLEYLVPDSSTLARQLNCFTKGALIKLKHDILTYLLHVFYSA